jgi:hypothetical protein
MKWVMNLLTNRNISIQFLSPELALLFTKVEIGTMLTELSKVLGENGKRVIPENGQTLTEYEFLKLYYLWLAFKNIKECKGFDLHLKEYSNNPSTTFFITLLADIFLAHQLNVELEPDIDNQSKKPDLLVSLNDIEIYFEGKQPQDPNQFELAEEQRELFNQLLPVINNNYSLAIFYGEMLNKDEMDIIKNDLSTILPKVTSEGEVYKNEKLGVSIVLSGLGNTYISDSNNIELLGIPTFNKNLCLANAFNTFGKNIVFYKKATPFNRVINEQLRKSRNKVPKGSPYVVVIDASTPRYDINDIEEYIKVRFNEAIEAEKTISGVLLINFQIDPQELVILEMKYVANPNSTEPLEWLKDFFLPAYSKHEIRTKHSMNVRL